MYKTFFSLLLLVTIVQVNIKACSCMNIPRSFSENITVEHVIFRAEVLDHVKLKERADFSFVYNGLTKLKVIHWYQNQMQSDTIYYGNGDGAMCTTSIAHYKVGEELILKATSANWIPEGNLFQPSDEKIRKELEAYKHLPLVGYNICDRSMLSVEKQEVVGNITKNIPLRKRNFESFLRKFSKRWADNRERKRLKENRRQQMSLIRFERLMKNIRFD